jgi:outer membrane cobalamin receptor
MLEYFPGVFIYTLGSVGQPNAFTINGFQTVAFLSDGVPINDPLNGMYNIYLYPVEYIGKIEYISGTKSFYYGLNSNSGIVNLISKNFKSLKPYTKIRYSESAYEETFFDGMFSQNFLSNLNFNGGVQRIAADGMFANSAYDAWNARAKLRYDITDNLNIYFSEIYNQNELELNEGVDISKTPGKFLYDRLQAVVRNTNSYEKVARNDLHLGATAKILPDSSSVSNINFYLSNQMRRYNDNGVRQSYQSRRMGVKFTQHIDFRVFSNSAISKDSSSDTSMSLQVRTGLLENGPDTTELRVLSSNVLRNGKYPENQCPISSFNTDFGFDVQSRQIFAGLPVGYKANTVISVFGKTAYRPINKLEVSGYFRNDSYIKKHYLSFGVDAQYNALDGLALIGGYSESYRLPTFQENYWRDTTILGDVNNFNPEKHKLLEVGCSFRWKDIVKVRATYFTQSINEAIIPIPTSSNYPALSFRFTNDDINTSGINMSGEIRIWKVTGIFNSIFFVNHNSVTSYLPIASIIGEIFFKDMFFKDNLDLKFGIRARAISNQKGFEFNSRTLTYLQSSEYELGTGGSIDAFVFGRIGSAIVHIVLENILDNQYLSTKFYPIQDRSLRFGVSWEFEN